MIQPSDCTILSRGSLEKNYLSIYFAWSNMVQNFVVHHLPLAENNYLKNELDRKLHHNQHNNLPHNSIAWVL